jgi:hypothetical protein
MMLGVVSDYIHEVANLRRDEINCFGAFFQQYFKLCHSLWHNLKMGKTITIHKIILSL